jgi:hypothetical protein
MIGRPWWTLDAQQLDTEGSDALDETIKGKYSNVVIGQFFEMLCTKIFTGCEYLSNGDAVSPDAAIFNGNSDYVFEVKATCKQPLIDVLQVKNYRKFIRQAPFPFTHPRVFYVLFLYRRVAVDEERTVRQLGQALQGRIIACIIFTLSIMERLCKTNQWLFRCGANWNAIQKGNADLVYMRWNKDFGDFLLCGKRGPIQSRLQCLNINTSVVEASSSIARVGEFLVPEFPIVICGNGARNLRRLLQRNER